jgi:sec-independent protein translocase protein TatB
MFELDWAKLLIIMVVAIIVVGPKELPGLLRMLGRTLAVLRRYAEQFRFQFEQSLQEITKDVGVDEIRDDLRRLKELNPASQIRNSLDQAMQDVPSPDLYLRGEPAPGAAMDAFEDPAPSPPQAEAASQPSQPEPATPPMPPQPQSGGGGPVEPAEPAVAPAAGEEPAPSFAAPKENKEKLEPAAVN